MQATATDLIARKMRAAELVDGDLAGGLAQFDAGGGNFLLELAHEVLQAPQRPTPPPQQDVEPQAEPAPAPEIPVETIVEPPVAPPAAPAPVRKAIGYYREAMARRMQRSGAARAA